MTGEVPPMQLTGLFQIGSFQSVKLVTRRDGTTLPGFHEVEVSRGAGYPMRCTISEDDRESGEPNPAWAAFQALSLKVGETVAVKVVGKASGKFVNYEAVHFIALDRQTAAAK
jgi:hypothetical protein